MAGKIHLYLLNIPTWISKSFLCNFQSGRKQSHRKLAVKGGCQGAQLSHRETGYSLFQRWDGQVDHCCKLPGKRKYRRLWESLSTFFSQEGLVALSSTNYKFPNPRHLGASLKQGLLMLRLVVNCNSLESGWFVSQSSSMDCSCQWHLFQMLLHRALSYSKMRNSFHRLPKGEEWQAGDRTLQPLGSRLINKKVTA